MRVGGRRRAARDPGLLTAERGGDVDLRRMPAEVVAMCRAAWSALACAANAVVHGDPAPRTWAYAGTRVDKPAPIPPRWATLPKSGAPASGAGVSVRGAGGEGRVPTARRPRSQ